MFSILVLLLNITHVFNQYISACIDICYLSNPERYGSLLTLDELKEFDMLSDDYEINWHLRSVINPTSEDLKSRSAKVKNRRRAFMDKLMNGGKLFSEDSMRDREPYLHHEAEEALLMEKIRMEQQRLGVDEMDWVGNERREEEQEEQEEEEDEDDEEVEEGKHGDANVREVSGLKYITAKHLAQAIQVVSFVHAILPGRCSLLLLVFQLIVFDIIMDVNLDMKWQEVGFLQRVLSKTLHEADVLKIFKEVTIIFDIRISDAFAPVDISIPQARAKFLTFVHDVYCLSL
ncbi:coiled-coil domain-containing protein 97 [Tanacetum coccineum]